MSLLVFRRSLIVEGWLGLSSYGSCHILELIFHVSSLMYNVYKKLFAFHSKCINRDKIQYSQLFAFQSTPSPSSQIYPVTKHRNSIITLQIRQNTNQMTTTLSPPANKNWHLQLGSGTRRSTCTTQKPTSIHPHEPPRPTKHHSHNSSLSAPLSKQ